MTPLVVLTIFFGFYPGPLLDASAASVEALIKNYQAALVTAEQAHIALAP
jgi:NADH-quinone oxidoreductase subunit M